MDLKQKIKAEAARLGFCACGFSAAQTPPHYAVYTRWLGAGRHAGMDYLARPTEISLRQDPARLLPGAKTILSLAAQYPVVRARGFQGFLHSNATPVPLQDMGLQIATYAQVEDYHLLLPPMMDALADFIQQAIDQDLCFNLNIFNYFW